MPAKKSNTPVPRVTPPDPYNADGVLVLRGILAGETFTAEENGVFIPEWYWRRLFDYITDTQAQQDLYTELQ